MNTSDKPGRNYKEWLRKNAWPFVKRERETGDSILPHLQEFLDESKLLGKRQNEETGRKKTSERDKPRH